MFVCHAMHHNVLSVHLWGGVATVLLCHEMEQCPLSANLYPSLPTTTCQWTVRYLFKASNTSGARVCGHSVAVVFFSRRYSDALSV